MNNAEGRIIKRKMSVVPKLYDLDMQAVVYNANYFKWFDQARFELISEIISIDEILETGLTFMIAENQCTYKNYASYGDPLLLFTSHRLQPAYQGRLVFDHSIVHDRKKIEIASGYSSMVVVNQKTKQLVKELPDFIWERYKNLT